MKYDAVLEGGGAKIPGLVGALEAIENHGFTPSHLAGTSAGAIVAGLRCAGYSPTELRDTLFSMNFRDFLDRPTFGTRAYNFWINKGIYKGDAFYHWIKEKLAAKNVKTFGDLAVSGETDPKYRWSLKVIACDLSYKRMRVFPNDCYETRPEDLEVALAIRMSMSIPYFFYPVLFEDSYIVDGGVLSNFPLWIYDSTEPPDWPTFGILLQEDSSGAEKKEIKGPVDFFRAMFDTMMVAHDRKFIRPGDYAYRTIQVPVGSIATTNFDLSHLEKDWLYYNGVKAANEFLSGWSFEAYVQWANRIRGVA